MTSDRRRFGLFHNEPNTRHYARGSEVFRVGEPGTTMFAVSGGQVAVMLEGKVVDTLGPDEVFGEMALLDQSTRTATVVAVEDSDLVEIDKTRFYLLVRQNPHFALQLMQLLSDRLRRANALYAETR